MNPTRGTTPSDHTGPDTRQGADPIAANPRRPPPPVAAAGDGTTGGHGVTVAAELARMSVQALRLYERKGLLEPARTAGGTRRYSDDDIARLRRIGELIDNGINLTGIAHILSLAADNAAIRDHNRNLRTDNRALRSRNSKLTTDNAALRAANIAITKDHPGQAGRHHHDPT